MKPLSRIAKFAALASFLLLFALGVSTVSRAQQEAAAPSPGIQQEVSKPPAAESEAASGAKPEEKEDAQEKMERELKFSPSVRKLAKILHVSPELGYWISLVLDFVLLAGLIGWAMKKKLPAMFRSRTQTIQRGIQEARAASDDANRRLAGIESRLAKLDSEVAAMRSAAETEAAAEEQRIMAAAAEDTRRVVGAAESEIAAAARQAHRELKAFAADLAVGLAEKRIQVDTATDQALVSKFTSQLGSAEEGGNGKDGR